MQETEPPVIVMQKNEFNAGNWGLMIALESLKEQFLSYTPVNDLWTNMVLTYWSSSTSEYTTGILSSRIEHYGWDPGISKPESKKNLCF